MSAMHEKARRARCERAAIALLALLAACRGNPSEQSLRRAASRAEALAAEAASRPVAGEHAHQGPPVAAGEGGPARWVPALHQAFSPESAFETVVFADRTYRAPANEGYDETLDHVAGRLAAAGFGSDPRLLLEVHETKAESPAWTPRRGRIVLHAPGAEARSLHAFERPEDPDRVMLPQNAPRARVEGPIVLDLGNLVEGAIFVTQSPLRRDLINRAALRGAIAVVSSALATYNVDPTGAERHLDAIQYRVLDFEPQLPVAQISPRSHAAIVEALRASDEVRLELESEVAIAERPLRTLVATIVGRARPEEAVVIASHLQEPGACDNASGVAGLAESAVSLAGLLRAGTFLWPARSLAFVWGDEKQQSRVWFEHSGRTAVAGISSDMTGQSRARTGAIALLERMPDPGAVHPLAPDEHTPWGESPVEAGSLAPNGLAVIARCAMADVSRTVGGWVTREHPWEGGSDHDVFILEHGVPAVLFWHFTDFAYHTSLDRLSHVDPEEMRRSAVAILATALAVADPRPADLDRYLDSLTLERELRLAACASASDEELARLWTDWCGGARQWLRSLCLDLPFPATAGAGRESPAPR